MRSLWNETYVSGKRGSSLWHVSCPYRLFASASEEASGLVAPIRSRRHPLRLHTINAGTALELVTMTIRAKCTRHLSGPQPPNELRRLCSCEEGKQSRGESEPQSESRRPHDRTIQVDAQCLIFGADRLSRVTCRSWDCGVAEGEGQLGFEFLMWRAPPPPPPSAQDPTAAHHTTQLHTFGYTNQQSSSEQRAVAANILRL